MRVWRGSTTIKQVLAKEYADAGGPLAPPEAKALVSCILKELIPCMLCRFSVQQVHTEAAAISFTCRRQRQSGTM